MSMLAGKLSIRGGHLSIAHFAPARSCGVPTGLNQSLASPLAALGLQVAYLPADVARFLAMWALCDCVCGRSTRVTLGGLRALSCQMPQHATIVARLCLVVIRGSSTASVVATKATVTRLSAGASSLFGDDIVQRHVKSGRHGSVVRGPSRESRC